MGKTEIEWTDSTWQVTNGCRSYSAGCANCYAEVMSNRLAGMAMADLAANKDPGRKANYLKVIQNGGWRGNVVCIPEALRDPFTWKKPRKVFVNSMSDLFYGDDADRRFCEAKGIPFEPVPFEFIDQVFAVMALNPRHTFQILTKRTARMAEYMAGLGHRIYGQVSDWLDEGEAGFLGKHWDAAHELAGASASGSIVDFTAWNTPLLNVHLGTSIENQPTADERILWLLKCPAVVRFLSCEPLLGPVDLTFLTTGPDDGSGWIYRHWDCLDGSNWCDCQDFIHPLGTNPINWVIVGGESGPGARPMHPDWARSIRDQCVGAGVPFLFKQWGQFEPCNPGDHGGVIVRANGEIVEDVGFDTRPGSFSMRSVGKKTAGRLLDGRTWDEFPQVESQHQKSGSIAPVAPAQ